jgi:hypothetical protein
MNRPQRKRRHRVPKVSAQPVVPVAMELLDGLPFATLILDHALTVQGINREGIRLLGVGSSSGQGLFFPGLWAQLS